MALISGYGGTVTFSGQSAVACRSVTINFERQSFDVTTIGDFREKRAPGRVRRFGSLSLYRQDGTIDNTLRDHMMPTSVANTTGAVLTFKYVDQGSQIYDQYGSGTGSINIHVTSATLTDDGSGAAMWELSWEEQ